MIIIRKDNKHVDFGTLLKGDIFKYEDGVFMVIEEVENTRGSVYNAVTVDTGELTHFYADEEVCPLHAELIVS